MPGALQLGTFCLVFFLLQWAWGRLEGSALEAVVIHQWTVAPATWLVNWVAPQIEAVASGHRMLAVGGGINVINGCDGLDVLFLTVAAFCVYRAHWKHWLIGLSLGLAFVWALNQVRIVALFFANRHDKDLFALAHGTLAPLALITLVTIAFALFVKLTSRQRPAL